MSGETLLGESELSLALLVELIPRRSVASLRQLPQHGTLRCGDLLQVRIVPFGIENSTSPQDFLHFLKIFGGHQSFL